MKRILIIGSGGSGKSSLAKRLHEASGLELIHLDKLYWQPDWGKLEKEDWQNTVEKLLEKKEWIMDGNYSGTLEMRLAACDTVIFLDLPRTVCIRRVIKRFLTYRRRTRPDMAEGCHEKLDLEFLKWIWDYPQRTKPIVEATLKRFEDRIRIFRLKSTREVESFFIQLQTNQVELSKKGIRDERKETKENPLLSD